MQIYGLYPLNKFDQLQSLFISSQLQLLFFLLMKSKPSMFTNNLFIKQVRYIDKVFRLLSSI